MAGGNEVSVAVGAGNTITIAVAGSTGTTPTITNGGTANVTVTSVGDRGPKGDLGPATTLSIGTVAGGETAAATLTGPAGAQVLSLVLPKGDKGDAGNTGAAGSTGATGPAGPANSLAIGLVTTGAAGSSASATVTGTAPNQTLSLTIPRGDTGAAGAAGQNIELQSTATHLQWRVVGGSTWTNLVALTAITGPQGATGAAGSNGTNGSSVELQASSTHIQWRLVGGSTWTNLVALSAITGPQGPAGSSGGSSGAQEFSASSLFASNGLTLTGSSPKYVFLEQWLGSGPGPVSLPSLASGDAGKEVFIMARSSAWDITHASTAIYSTNGNNGVWVLLVWTGAAWRVAAEGSLASPW